ncbi:MAG: starch-binding protein, partial [Ruminococcus sp.]
VTFSPNGKWTGSTFYCYAWNDASTTGPTWPGSPMTANGDGTYSYTVSSDCNKVIFNTGNNGKQTLDLELSDSAIYTLNGKTATNSGGTTCYDADVTPLGNTDPTYYPGVTESIYAKGDVNRDEVVNISDVTAIQKYLVLLETFDREQISLADFNKSGRVTIKDATDIQYSLLS